MPQITAHDENPRRPLRRYVLRGLALLAGALLLAYLFLVLRFITSYPTPTVNYLEQLNSGKLSVPIEDHAWPIYRKAILALGNRDYKKESADLLEQIFDARPGGEHWPKVTPWLAQHGQVVELTRQASARRSLGFILGRNGSIDDRQLYPGRNPNARWDWDDAMLVGVLLPHLSELKELANVLAVDARVAREQGDAPRVIRDIEAMLNLAQQMHADDLFVVEALVAIGIRQLALEQAEASLLEENCRLTDDDLRKLSQMLSTPQVAADLVDFSGTRLMIQDLVQRCYTDDGHGDGHMTLEGQRLLDAIRPMRQPGQKAGSEAFHGAMITLLAPALSASRKDVLEHYTKMLDLADANLKRPMREAHWAEYEQNNGDFEKFRRPMAILMAESVSSVQERAEKWLGHRDGVTCAIALELWRRQHGHWPVNLQSLIPDYLSAIPADRITGEAIKSKLVNGKPLIYSVGADRDDDGGRPAPGKNSSAKTAQWGIAKEQATDGDWILFPQSSEQ